MTNAINPTAILLPMLAVVALTFVAIFRMMAGRAAAMKAGQDVNYYRVQLGAPEPEATIAAVRHYGNLLELPVLFYAACLTAFLLAAVSPWTLGFAWAYVAARLVQSAVHLTYNAPAHRGMAFMLGVLFMLLLWINLGWTIVCRL